MDLASRSSPSSSRRCAHRRPRAFPQGPSAHGCSCDRRSSRSSTCVFALPFMYTFTRRGPSGHRPQDADRGRSEASVLRSRGHLLRVILPNLRSARSSVVPLLTVAIAMGEFTVASLMGFDHLRRVHLPDRRQYCLRRCGAVLHQPPPRLGHDARPVPTRPRRP